MKALIFGANGQDGYYLKTLLESCKIDVIPISRGAGIIGNVNDFAFVTDQIKQHQPTYIFHLAANSSTWHDAIFENHQTISTGTLNILETVHLYCRDAKVFLSGSGVQFKNDGNPINEQTPFEASSPYAVSRIQSIYAGRYYRDVLGLKVYVGYFFSHDSPLRGDNHINQKIAKTVKRIAEGRDNVLELGNIEVQKEFNFAGDCMEAIWMLVNQDTIFEAVIGSGKAHSIKEWVIGCFEKIGKNWQDFVVLKPGYVPEYMKLVSDPKLIYSLGWRPKVNFDELVDLIMTINNG